jgi:hypothetical protein
MDLPSGLYYKSMAIVNDDSRVVNKLEASLTDYTRVIIYNRHMFIVQAPDHFPSQHCQPGGLNKDPIVWLDGARSPQ